MAVLFLAAMVAAIDVDWKLGMSASERAITVAAGEDVVFTWENYHDVYESNSKANYDACAKSSSDGSSLHSGTSGTSSSPATYTLSTTSYAAGTYYFICTVGTHCENDQKIAITITPSPPHPPSPPKASPPPKAAASPSPSPPEVLADPCFPSSAIVSKPDGTSIRIDTLKEGDAILALTAEGTLTFDRVSLFSTAAPEAKAQGFLTLTTSGVAHTNLTLTPEHHLPVGPACCSNLRQAKDVREGDTVWAVLPPAHTVAQQVLKVSFHTKDGLHSPVLVGGGMPVVDGFVTSFDSMAKVRLAAFGLRHLGAACKVTGTCSLMREQLLGPRSFIEMQG